MRTLSLLLLLLRLQQAPATVEGVVVDSESRQPLAGATVTVQDRGPAAGKMILVTGFDGRFVFRNVTPGQYNIEASRSGYVPALAGEAAATPNMPLNSIFPPETPIVQQLSPGQALSNLRLVLTPGAVITGRLTNDHGDIVVGAVVQALKTTHRNGLRERTLVQSVVSNDLGEFRFFMLKPGQYYLALIPPALSIPNVTTPGFPLPLFYPGTIDVKEAKAIDLHVGETIGGMNFTSIPTKNRKITGGVQNNGSDGVVVTLSPANGMANKKFTIDRPLQNSNFQFSEIVPGAYTLVANSVDRRSAVALDVRNTDVLGTRIIMGENSHIPARARIEGHPPGNDPALENIYLFLRPNIAVPGLEPELYSPFADGHFTLEVLQRDYWLEITRSEDYYIKSATLEGFDVLNRGLHVTGNVDKPVEIVFDTRFGEVQGTAARPNVTVVLVPDATRRNQVPLYRWTKAGNGAFHFEKVPPGDYKLFVWSEDMIDNGGPWLDPDYLRIYEDRATPVRIQADTKTNVDRPVAVF